MMVFVWFLEMLKWFHLQSIILQTPLCAIVPKDVSMKAGDLLTWDF